MKKTMVLMGTVLVLGLALAGCPSNNDPMPPELPVLTGTVTIEGTAQVGQTLRANIAALGDISTPSFQWRRITGAGETNVGTNSGMYVLQADDEGHFISVTVTHAGFSGSVTSTTAVGPVAGAPSYDCANCNDIGCPVCDPDIVEVPGTTLADQLAWLRATAQSGGAYSIELGADEYIAPYLAVLPTGRSNLTITLLGGGAMRTLSLSQQGSFFTIGEGITLVLGNNISLYGISMNANPLVRVDRGGSLIMNSGARIAGNIGPFSWDGVRRGGVLVNDGGTFAMYGGEITGNAGSGGNGVFNYGVFHMHGGEISGNSGDGVFSYGVFHMHGGEISGNSSSGVSGSAFHMHGGEISGNSGGGVHVWSSGSFAMYEGRISGNTTNIGGGGVSVSGGGTFTMRGGEIYGNTSDTSGGGVSVSTGGTFTIHGGEISGNDTRGNGGGIATWGEGNTFTMYGGKISGNTAAGDGGGVHVGEDGTFIMRGGEISGNTASSGGGVANHNGTFQISNGTIFGNEPVLAGLGNSAFSGAALFNYHWGYHWGWAAPPTSQRGTFNDAGVFDRLGDLANTDNTIRVVNGVFPLHDCDLDGHIWGGWSVTTPPTFTSPGEKTRTCNECGDTDTHTIPQSKLVTVPGLTLAEQLEWLRLNAQSGNYYIVEIGGDEHITPAQAELPGYVWGISITLRGIGGMRTVSLASNGSLFDIGSGVTLILDENVTLQGRADNSWDELVWIGDGGTLVMNDGSRIIGNYGGVYVGYGTFIMYGGEISGNSVGVSVWDGTFAMHGGEISGNTSAGVYVRYGTFAMYGGEISTTGHGVYVRYGIFAIYGGEISGNSVGVSVIYGTFAMHGGEISGNIEHGVFVIWDSTFIMHGGEISGNGNGMAIWGHGTFAMYGGEISGNSGSGVSVGYGTFIMHGGEISSNGGGVNVGNGTFTMRDGGISGNSYSGVGVYGGTFTMYDGGISGNSGSGVDIGGNGTFAMYDGKISGNSGSGVRIWNGTFVMHDGRISGNTATGVWSGGGVTVGATGSDGTFAMYGGEISGNIATGAWGSSGGVRITRGTFAMYGGEISGNIASGSYGSGGVYVDYHGTFSMHDGKISGNTATGAWSGGGVYVSFQGTFHISNGLIHGSDAEWGLGNMGNPAALFCSGTTQRGRFSDGVFTSLGTISSTDNTIHVVNGQVVRGEAGFTISLADFIDMAPGYITGPILNLADGQAETYITVLVDRERYRVDGIRWFFDGREITGAAVSANGETLTIGPIIHGSMLGAGTHRVTVVVSINGRPYSRVITFTVLQ